MIGGTAGIPAQTLRLLAQDVLKPLQGAIAIATVDLRE